MDVETNRQQISDAVALSTMYVTGLIVLLVFIPIVFPESAPKSKAQFLGYVAGSMLWPTVCIGWVCWAAWRLVRWFWSLPMVEQEPKP